MIVNQLLDDHPLDFIDGVYSDDITNYMVETFGSWEQADKACSMGVRA
jgi:hypothetical protein